MSACAQAGKWFGGCHFEPRYDEPVLSDVEKTVGRSAWVKVEGTDKVGWQDQPLGQKTYVHDICIRCGKVVERVKHADATQNRTTPITKQEP